MFVTIVRDNNQLAAVVHCDEHRLDISNGPEKVCSMLRQVYHPKMTPLEYAKANYQLNRFRPYGITWELMLASEFEASGS